MSGLIGRRARGPWADAAATADGKRPIVEGEIVVADVHDTYLRIWILDGEHRLRLLIGRDTVILPRGAEAPLRDLPLIQESEQPVRFVTDTARARGHRLQWGDRHATGDLAGLRFDAAEVICTLDDLDSSDFRGWCRAVVSRCSSPRGGQIRLTVLHGEPGAEEGR